MGGCYSTHGKPVRRRKRLHYRSAKRRGRIPHFPAGGTPKRISDAGSFVSDTAASQFLHNIAMPERSACRKSEASNSSIHRKHIQRQHSQIDAGVICQDEAWFDSVSMLESDSDEEFSSAHGDNLSIVSNPIGHLPTGEVLSYESAPRFIDNGCKYKAYCGGYVKSDGRNADELCNNTKQLLDCSLGSLNYLEKTYDKSPKLKVGFPNLLPTLSFNGINVETDCGPLSQQMKSAVIRLSFKRRSCDGEESRASKRFMYRPKAGFLIPRSTEETIERCWSEVSPSKFHLRSENYFKDKKKCPAPDICPLQTIWRRFICLQKKNKSYCSTS